MIRYKCEEKIGLFGIIFVLAFNSCGSSINPIDLKPRELSLDIPEISITVNGAHIPDRDNPEYKDYCPAVLNYLEGESHYLDNEGRVRIRGTSSRWFKKKGYKIKFSTKVSIGGLPASKKYNILASYLVCSFC